jgi:heme/copper-type cytochrome/quinol oxidase subunit 3
MADNSASLSVVSPPASTHHVTELSIKKPVGAIAGLVCAVIALSAGAGIAASLLGSTPLWFLLGFEIVTLFAAVFGILLALGRFSDGPALGLLCVVGAVAVGSILGDMSTQLANPIGGPVLYTYGKGGLVQIPITAFMTLRLAAAGIVGLCAAWTVLHRRPAESMKSLTLGLILGTIMLVVLAVAWKARAPLAGLGTLVRTLTMFAVGVSALGLLAASVHYTIRAFEFGRIASDRNAQPPRLN